MVYIYLNGLNPISITSELNPCPDQLFMATACQCFEWREQCRDYVSLYYIYMCVYICMCVYIFIGVYVCMMISHYDSQAKQKQLNASRSGVSGINLFICHGKFDKT